MTATAAAFYKLYKTLPPEVKEEVKTLIGSEDDEKRLTAQKWEEIEAFFKPLRKGLPADYRFDREEANAR